MVLRRDVDVRLTVQNGAGDVVLPDGRKASGLGTSETYTLHPADGTVPRGTLDLTLKAGLGDIKVAQV